MAYDIREMIEDFADAFTHVQGIQKEMNELKHKIGTAYSSHNEIFMADADPALMEDIHQYLQLNETLREAELVLERHEKQLKPVVNLIQNKSLSHKTNSGRGEISFDIIERDGRLAVTNIRKTE